MKTLIALIALVSITAHTNANAANVDGIRVVKAPNCTTEEFNTQANSEGMYVISADTDPYVGDILYLDRNQWTQLEVWSTPIKYYRNLPTVHDEIEDDIFDMVLFMAKLFIEENAPCLVFDSIDEDDKTFSLVGPYDLKGLGSSVNYTELQSKLLPTDDKKPIAYTIDSVVWQNQLLPGYFDKIIAKSFVDNEAPLQFTNELTTTSHGTMGVNAIASLSYGKIGLEVTQISGEDVLHALSMKAMNDIIDKCTLADECSIGRPFGNYHSKSAKEKNAFKRAHDKGIVIAQAIGNKNKQKADTNTYDDNIITYGAVKKYLYGYQQTTSYGPDGPDLVIPQDGSRPVVNADGSISIVDGNPNMPVFYSESQDSVAYADGKYGGSSQAANKGNAIQSILQDQCRLKSGGKIHATPDQIKKALCDTAVKLPVFSTNLPDTGLNIANWVINNQNSYVNARCGVIQPVAALNKLLTDVCTAPVEPPKTLAWCWPSTCRWSPANFPPQVISEAAKACQLAGFTVSYGLAGTPDELFCTNVTVPFFYYYY